MLVTTTRLLRVDVSPAIMASFPVRRLSVPMYSVDFFASIRDVVGGRSGSYEEVLREAKETALREMQENARAMGANAVIGVDLDYETVGGSGSMLMVTACGTAVTVE